MQYVCDAPDGKTWFRIETVEEAAKESALMNHAVEKHFRQQWDAAATSFKPASSVYIEQNIGLKSHVQRKMPLFLTLRNGDGDGLATAMLPPGGKNKGGFRIIIVGPSNSDPYTEHDAAIRALGTHFGLTLDRESCYPYLR
jgi:hypothetical protein